MLRIMLTLNNLMASSNTNLDIMHVATFSVQHRGFPSIS